MDVGFIGLGNMGHAMVENMLKAGHQVRVWNRTRERAAPLAELGARIVDAPAAAFSGDAVFSMLADDAAVLAAAVRRRVKAWHSTAQSGWPVASSNSSIMP